MGKIAITLVVSFMLVSCGPRPIHTTFVSVPQPQTVSPNPTNIRNMVSAMLGEPAQNFIVSSVTFTPNADPDINDTLSSAKELCVEIQYTKYAAQPGTFASICLE